MTQGNGAPKTPRKRRAATTPEARENQLINLAVDRAEQMLRDGSAPTPVITHYLALATTKKKLENKKLEAEVEVLHSRIAGMEQERESQVSYQAVIEALRKYSGQEAFPEDDETEYYDR